MPSKKTAPQTQAPIVHDLPAPSPDEAIQAVAEQQGISLQDAKALLLQTGGLAPINTDPVSGSKNALSGKARRLAEKAAKLNARMAAQHIKPRAQADMNDRAVRGDIRYNHAPIISDDNILELDKRIRAGDKDVIARIPLAYTTRPKYLRAVYKADGTPDKRNDPWLRARVDFARRFSDGAKDSRGVLIPGAIETDEDGRWVMHLPLTEGRLAAMVVYGDLASLLAHAGTLRSTEESTLRFMASLEVAMPEIAAVYRAASAYVRGVEALDKAEARLLSASSDKRVAAIRSRDKAHVALYGDAKQPDQPSHVSRLIAAWHAALDIHDPSVKADVAHEISALVPADGADVVISVDADTNAHVTASA